MKIVLYCQAWNGLNVDDKIITIPQTNINPFKKSIAS